MVVAGNVSPTMARPGGAAKVLVFALASGKR